MTELLRALATDVVALYRAWRDDVAWTRLTARAVGVRPRRLESRASLRRRTLAALRGRAVARGAS